MKRIQPFGACNVQLRMEGDVLWVFEINARYSGTTASRTLCGFNEPKMIADYLINDIEPLYKIQKKTNLRYWHEMQIENSLVDELCHNSTICKYSYTLL